MEEKQKEVLVEKQAELQLDYKKDNEILSNQAYSFIKTIYPYLTVDDKNNEVQIIVAKSQWDSFELNLERIPFLLNRDKITIYINIINIIVFTIMIWLIER